MNELSRESPTNELKHEKLFPKLCKSFLIFWKNYTLPILGGGAGLEMQAVLFGNVSLRGENLILDGHP